MGDKKGYAAALEHLMSERQKVVDNGKELVDQHEQLTVSGSGRFLSFL